MRRTRRSRRANLPLYRRNTKVPISPKADRDRRLVVTRSIVSRLEARLLGITSIEKLSAEERELTAQEIEEVVGRVREFLQRRPPLWFKAWDGESDSLADRFRKGSAASLDDARGFVHGASYALMRIRHPSK